MTYSETVEQEVGKFAQSVDSTVTERTDTERYIIQSRRLRKGIPVMTLGRGLPVKQYTVKYLDEPDYFDAFNSPELSMVYTRLTVRRFTYTGQWVDGMVDYGEFVPCHVYNEVRKTLKSHDASTIFRESCRVYYSEIIKTVKE